MTQIMNLAFGANFDLLKTNLAAVFEKDENGTKILLIPTKVDSPTPVTLGEMLADFESAFGINPDDLGNIESGLKAVNEGNKKFNINAITFQLQSAFLYKDSSIMKEKEAEYAFAISVDMSEALPDFGFAKLNSLFFAVWNTERETVLRQIGTGNITKLLANLDA